MLSFHHQSNRIRIVDFHLVGALLVRIAALVLTILNAVILCVALTWQLALGFAIRYAAQKANVLFAVALGGRQAIRTLSRLIYYSRHI